MLARTRRDVGFQVDLVPQPVGLTTYRAVVARTRITKRGKVTVLRRAASAPWVVHVVEPEPLYEDLALVHWSVHDVSVDPGFETDSLDFTADLELRDEGRTALVEWRLDSACTSGVLDLDINRFGGSSETPAAVQVLGDGAVLLERTVSRGQAVMPTADLEGVTMLRIEATRLASDPEDEYFDDTVQVRIDTFESTLRCLAGSQD